MEAFKVSKDSWHYKLLSRSTYDIPTDICSYTRKLFGTLFLICGVVSIVGFVVAFYCYSGYVFFDWLLFNGQWDQINVFFLMLTGMVSVVVSAVVGKEKLSDFFNSEIRTPSFIREAYSAFKNKHCIKLEFVDKE
jgi:hypothetical protein